MARNQGNWQNLLFYIGLSLLICHELDAVARHEWRLLPIFNILADETARIAFIVGHIPLLAAIFWLTGHQSSRLRRRSQLSVDLFLILHAALHFALSGHELYEFEAPLEWLLIYGGAVVGFFHLLMLRRPAVS